MVDENVRRPEDLQEQPNNGAVDFGVDKAVDEYELIKAGTYEVALEKLEIKKSNKDGKVTNYLNITFVIRSDVDQEFKGRKVWFTIFEGDPSPLNKVAFNFNAVNKLIVTQAWKEDEEHGYRTHFTERDEVFQYLQGLHMRLDIAVAFNDFKGKDDNAVVKDSFAPSEWDKTHSVPGVPGSQGNNLDGLDTPDDDLPF